MLKDGSLIGLEPYFAVEGTGETSIGKLLAIGRLAAQTKENYLMRIRAYLRRVGATPDDFIQKVGTDPKQFEEEFIAFIGETSEKSASSTTAFWRDALKKFLEVNRVRSVDWDYINQFLPRVRKAGLDRAPTTEEIWRLLEVADVRTRCLILYLCSSGARIGSVEYLHWGDFQETEFEGAKLAKVKIYKGEPEEYDTFVTPECWASLMNYRQARQKAGEGITDWTPVFVRLRTGFRQDPVPIGVRSLKNQLGDLMNRMEMRSKIMDKERHRSYEFKQAHGFRKFFKTRMEMSGAKPIITEMLMGHAIGISRSYMKPTREELIREYGKGIDGLTIIKADPGTSA
jgi:integrase